MGFCNLERLARVAEPDLRHYPSEIQIWSSIGNGSIICVDKFEMEAQCGSATWSALYDGLLNPFLGQYPLRIQINIQSVTGQSIEMEFEIEEALHDSMGFGNLEGLRGLLNPFRANISPTRHHIHRMSNIGCRLSQWLITIYVISINNESKSRIKWKWMELRELTERRSLCRRCYANGNRKAAEANRTRKDRTRQYCGRRFHCGFRPESALRSSPSPSSAVGCRFNVIALIINWFLD